MTLTKGTKVQYRDRANRKRTGTIDSIKTGFIQGTRLYRVNDHWLPREGLRAA